MIVLDANAAMLLLQGEHSIDSFMLETGEKVIAPEVFHSELANALWKYAAFSDWDARSLSLAYAELTSMVDEFVPDAPLFPEALMEAARLGHPVYDMLYVVLARRNGATLVTLDEKLQKLCEQCGVSCTQTVAL